MYQKSLQSSGGYDEKVTPVPIPNTVVKLLSADDTWMETSRESRSLPDLYQSLMVYAIRLCLFSSFQKILYFFGLVYTACHTMRVKNTRS
jgi:hypothetical protein